MATQVQRRRGNTAQNNAFLGALGELAFNTELIGLRLHDGVTVGGHRIAMFSDIVSPPFADTTNVVMGSVDPTKLLRFEVDGFTAATTRVLTPQDASYIIAGTNIANTFSVNQTFGAQLLPADGTSAAPAYSFIADSTMGFYRAGNSVSFARAGIDHIVFAVGSVQVRNNAGAIHFGTAQDAILIREAANTIAQRNGVNEQTLNVYQTFTDSVNNRRAEIGSRYGSDLSFMAVGIGTGANPAVYYGTTGTASLHLVTLDTTRWSVTSAGHLLAVADNTYDIGAMGATRPRNVFVANNVQIDGDFVHSSRGRLDPFSDGVWTFLNNTTTDFNRLQFGGTSSSFPALKRSTTGLQFRLADDSAYTFADALEYRASGTKVVGAQGAAVADAAGGATVDAEARTAINTLLARLRTHGLIAT